MYYTHVYYSDRLNRRIMLNVNNTGKNKYEISRPSLCRDNKNVWLRYFILFRSSFVSFNIRQNKRWEDMHAHR